MTKPRTRFVAFVMAAALVAGCGGERSSNTVFNPFLEPPNFEVEGGDVERKLAQRARSRGNLDGEVLLPPETPRRVHAPVGE